MLLLLLVLLLLLLVLLRYCYCSCCFILQNQLFCLFLNIRCTYVLTPHSSHCVGVRGAGDLGAVRRALLGPHLLGHVQPVHQGPLPALEGQGPGGRHHGQQQQQGQEEDVSGGSHVAPEYVFMVRWLVRKKTELFPSHL